MDGLPGGVHDKNFTGLHRLGGGYFYTLPGVQHGGDWYGRAILA